MRRRAVPFAIALALKLAVSPAVAAHIGGSVTVADGATSDGGVWVRLYPHLSSSSGHLLPLAKRSVDSYPGNAPAWAASARARGDPGSRRYTFSLECPPGNYSVLAFHDPTDAGALPLMHQYPLGWHTGEDCLGGAYNLCTTVVEVVDGQGIEGITVILRAPRPFPEAAAPERVRGELRLLRGTHVLHLAGSASERGFAHGYLLAEQIIDFFEFFILEDRVQSVQLYEREVLPNLRPESGTFRFSAEFEAAAAGVFEGMRASNVSLLVPSLRRNFQIEDLYAINTYAELDMLLDGAHGDLGRRVCTQFVFFGNETAGTDVRGGTLAGRNMDGEVDFRRLTVSHLVVFAVAPSQGKRYVSVMWPGFIGSLSGFNEDGLYIMENFGCPPPTAPSRGRHLRPNVDLVTTVLQSGDIGPSTTMRDVEETMSRLKSDDGGPCAHAAILFFALPREGGQADLPGGFAFECDRYGAEIRLPGSPDVRPTNPNSIFGSNHFMQYKTVAQDFDLDALTFKCNGGQPTFYSLWRYAVGQSTLEAWQRAGVSIGTEEVKQLLRTVSKGITEHSILWLPEQLSFELAVARLDAPLWDAPYQEWKRFAFADLFATANGSRRRMTTLLYQ